VRRDRGPLIETAGGEFNNELPSSDVVRERRVVSNSNVEVWPADTAASWQLSMNVGEPSLHGDVVQLGGQDERPRFGVLIVTVPPSIERSSSVVNSIRADSRTLQMTLSVEGRRPRVSNRAIDVLLRPALPPSTSCDQPSRRRPALTWAARWSLGGPRQSRALFCELYAGFFEGTPKACEIVRP
jgi:hypothetical protein